MPAFLSPIWLFAMAAFVIPLVIHLWNDKQGRVLSIGSIAFLQKDARRRSRTLLLSEKWLLFVRCLLLAVLALLLAGPYWKAGERTANGRGWVLVSDSSVGSGRFKPVIDSLTRAGFVRKAWPEGNNWWAAFSRLDRSAPVGLSFHVFTDARLTHFSGERPVTGREVHWYADTAASREANVRRVAAWAWKSDSVVVMSRESRATGNLFRTDVVAGSKVDGITVDTGALNVSVITDPGTVQDGKYVVAALRAVSSYTKRNVRVYNTVRKGSDWVIWLSDRPVSGDLSARHVLSYQPGKGTAVRTTMRGDGFEGVTVNKLVSGGDSTAEPVWRDGFGRGLLSRSRGKDSTVFYHLSTHFDPAWNGLVFSASMPVVLGNLILRDAVPVDTVGDLRVIDPGQLLPIKGSGAVVRSTVMDEGERSDWPAKLCWLLLVALFVTERILSHRNTNRITKQTSSE